MVKFSIVMLVSRVDKRFQKAVESVVRQEPDEFRAYIDTTSISFYDQPCVRRVLKDANAKVFVQHPTLAFDRHENLVHNYHRIMLEAKKGWIIKLDDDDELLGTDRHTLLERYAKDNVGIIHGDKVVSYPYGGYIKSGQLIRFIKSLTKPTFYKGGIPESYRDVRLKIWGGTAIINREAFKQVHPLLDHGYFYDYKTFYWILRSGWKSAYVPEVLFLQNLNPKISKEREQLWGTWDKVMGELDEIVVNS